MLHEGDYYPFVEEFIKDSFSCVVTGTNRGYLALGLIDVAGAYDTGSDLHSELEMIIAEVKTSTNSFGKSIGQTLGYSIYAERCYLAIPFVNNVGFTHSQVYMANHLGIGLIRIETDEVGTPKRGELILSSKRHTPIPSQKTHLLRSLGIAICYSCRDYCKLLEMEQIVRKSRSPSLFSGTSSRKLLLCKECYDQIVPEAMRSKRITRSMIARKAIESRRRKKFMSREQ
jgi:hypothetical protein